MECSDLASGATASNGAVTFLDSGSITSQYGTVSEVSLRPFYFNLALPGPIRLSPLFAL
jgi:hypothetical protein